MRTGKFSAIKFAATLFLITALISGCGGGEDQSGGSQDGGDKASGEDAKKEATKEPDEKKDGEKKKGENATAQVKLALGTVATVEMDKRKFAVSVSGEEKKRQSFKLQRKVGITVDGKAGTPEDIKEDQQVRLEYITKDDKNLVRSIQAFSADGGEETTG